MKILCYLLVLTVLHWQLNAVSAAAPDLNLFKDGLLAGLTVVTDQPSRIQCRVQNTGGLYGGKSIVAYTDNYALPGDNCYIKAYNGPASIAAYTELEFFIRADPVNHQKGYAGIELKDSANHLDGENANIPIPYTRFRFPLRNTFSGVNLASILSPFYLTLYLVKGDQTIVDQVVLRDRNYFDIFTDATDHGREVIYTWGGPACQVITRNDAPEGSHALSVPSNTWGCGLFYAEPFLDLSYYTSIQFYLKSSVDVLVELQSNTQKGGLTIPSTNGNWQLITRTIASFHVNLSQTYGPFLITKIGSNSGEVLVDRIRYI